MEVYKHIPLSKAQEMLGVSRQTMYVWHKKGIGPKRKYFGGRIFYSRDEVEAYKLD